MSALARYASVNDDPSVLPRDNEELARQRALGLYAFEDKGDALELDNLVRLAAEICQCKMAMVSVVDDEHENVHAAYGLSVDAIPRHTSFCSRTIAEDEMLLVEDARQDSRFSANPLAAGPPYVRFYVGIPLHGVDRHALGALCVLDTSPHHLGTSERQGLQTLAHQVELHFELRLHRRARAHRVEDKFFAVLSDPMCIVDSLGRIERANQAYCTVFGYTEPELVRRELTAFVHPDDKDRIRDIASGLRSDPGRPQHAVARYRDHQAKFLWVDWTAVSDEVGRIYAIARDQTADRRMRAEQVRLQKLESLGRITGSVAHDFNNLLAIIMTTTGSLDALLPMDSDLREELRGILVASESAAMLTRQLLAFVGKPGPGAPAPVDLETVLEGVERMLRGVLGSDGVGLDVEIADDLWPTLGDAGQIQQIMINLILNARDAMPSGGRVQVKASNERVEDQDWVRIRVADNGTGMDEATLLRIFEPYFTTKTPDKGTGLGLATVYTIVHQLEGRLTVSSQLGSGTEFQIDLRRA